MLGSGRGVSSADEEGDDAGLVAPGVVAPAAAAVAGAHLGAQDERSVDAGADGAQPGDPLRRLVVGDPRVVEPGGDEDRRIVGGDRVVVRRVAGDVAGERLGTWIAPLLPLRHGQRQRRVAHRRDDVDEGHLGDGGEEALGAHRDARADEQAAGAAAAQRQP